MNGGGTMGRKQKQVDTKTLKRDDRGHDRVRFSEMMRADTKLALVARAIQNGRNVNSELHAILNKALGLAL